MANRRRRYAVYRREVAVGGPRARGEEPPRRRCWAERSRGDAPEKSGPAIRVRRTQDGPSPRRRPARSPLGDAAVAAGPRGRSLVAAAAGRAATPARSHREPRAS